MRARLEIVVLLAVVGCGARTELHALDAARVDAPPSDAGVGIDAFVRPDAPDAFVTPDAFMPDIGVDAAYPCTGGLGSLAYVWDDGANLHRFDPSTLGTVLLGHVDCGRSDPWTLSVSRTGVAFMIYQDWHVYRVDLATLACTETPFDPNQLGFVGGEYAISVSRDAAAEQLLVYGRDASGRTHLAESDLTSFVLREIAPVDTMPVLYPVDMQADVLGHVDLLTVDGWFLQIDATTAAPMRMLDVPAYNAMMGDWAILPWNDTVYLFGGRISRVFRLDVATGALTSLGSLGFGVVGASAAACLH